MSHSSELCCFDNFSYQHIQGIMLKNLNLLASEVNLSHTEYRIMGILIGLWNKKHNMAFPNLNYLTKSCKMAKSTILRSLNRLVELGLIIVVKSKGQRNKYYFSNKFLMNTTGINKKTTGSFPWKTTHDKTDLNKETYKESFIHGLAKQENIVDDVSNINEYREMLSTLKSWLYPDPKSLIKKHGIYNLKATIKQVKEKAPANPGAYLRVILQSCQLSNSLQIKKDESAISYPDLFKSKFWKHLRSGRIFQVLPDVGMHLLYKYNSESNEVILFEENLKDNLSNFKPSSIEEYHDQNKEKITAKPSKNDIINEMIAQGRIEEAEYLKRIWQKESRK